MARRRFFVDPVRGGRAELSGDEARHLARVLRAEPGQRYELSDGAAVYLAEIDAVTKDRVGFRVLEALPAAELPVRVTLVAALVKFDRFEWMLEKATELGVEEVVPFEAARTEKGLAAASEKRVERWARILRESGQQSRRARLPRIGPAVSFERAASVEAQYRYMLEEEAGAPPLIAALPARRKPPDTVALLLGPEGGWTDEERARIRERGWQPVSLGPLVLRAETAAAAALAIIGNAWLAG